LIFNTGFVVQYFLADDSISVYEPPVHNSGFVGGKFIRRMRIKKEGVTPTTYYGPDDFYLEAIPIFFGQKFLITAESKSNWQFTSDMDHDTLLSMLLNTMRARGSRVTYTFRAVDEDGDGRINFTEFTNALNSLLGLTSGNAIPELVCAEVFRYFDTSLHGDELEGELSINEVSAQVQGHGIDGRRLSQQNMDGYLETLKKREAEIHVLNEQDMILRDFVSNFEESRGHIRGVFRDHDDDRNNLLSANEFCVAMTGANFNLTKYHADQLTKYFFGKDKDSYKITDELTFAEFAQKVSVLQMLPRMRGEI
tara:strand:- start:180 stop:1106 length:927 start_codon:yes stop_codon:yes gene_type:complete